MEIFTISESVQITESWDAWESQTKKIRENFPEFTGGDLGSKKDQEKKNYDNV